MFSHFIYNLMHCIQTFLPKLGFYIHSEMNVILRNHLFTYSHILLRDSVKQQFNIHYSDKTELLTNN